MASVDCMKMTAKHCGGMKRHLDDTLREKGNHSNKHINPELTHLNFWVGCENFSEMEQNMKSNISEIDSVHPPQREKEDRNVNISFYMVCPKELSDADKSKDFFEKAYEFIEKFCESKYGVSYACGMAVHRDEIHEYTDSGWENKTSLEHGHMWVTPYARWTAQRTVYGEDGKPLREAPTEEELAKNPKFKGKIVKESYTEEGLNAKHFLNKTFLTDLQQEFDAFIYQEYGIHYMTGETPRHKTVEELKAESAYAAAIIKKAEEVAEQIKEKNDELQSQNDKLAIDNFNLQKDIGDKKLQISQLDDQITEKNDELKGIDKQIKEKNEVLEPLKADISRLERQREGLQAEADKILSEAKEKAKEIIKKAYEASGMDKIMEAINRKLGIVTKKELSDARKEVLDQMDSFSDLVGDEERKLFDEGKYEELGNKVNDKCSVSDMRGWGFKMKLNEYSKLLKKPKTEQEVLQDIEKTMSRTAKKNFHI